MIGLLILVFVIIIAGVIGLIIWLVLRDKEEEVEEPPPPPGNDDEGGKPEPPPDDIFTEFEIVNINGDLINNYIFEDLAIVVDPGIFLTTNNGVLATSLTPSYEWSCQGLRLRSNKHTGMCVSMITSPGPSDWDLTVVILENENTGNSLQDILHDGKQLIFVNSYSNGAIAVLAGLGACSFVFANGFQIGAREEISARVVSLATGSGTSSKVSIDGNEITSQNISMRPIQSTREDFFYVGLLNYTETRPVSEPVARWNSVNKRIVNSSGGVLSLGINSYINERWIPITFEPYESGNEFQEAIVVDDIIYFTGSASKGYCYVLIGEFDGTLSGDRIDTVDIGESWVSNNYPVAWFV